MSDVPSTGLPVQASSSNLKHELAHPPPPYNHNDEIELGPDGEYVQQTQTLTVTTTMTTTTSFFPRMKRRTERSDADPHTAAASLSLLVNKELPAIPGNSGDATKKKKQSRRPKTAENHFPGQRRDSVVAMSMPLALAHASMGLNIPQIDPRWSFNASNTDPLTTPRSQSPTQRIQRRSMSLSVDPTSFISDAFNSSLPSMRLGGSLDHHSPVENVPLTSNSFWSPQSSSPAQTHPRKSKTMQNFPGLVDPKPAKQLTRRSSWWGRRKAESLTTTPSNDAISSNGLASSSPPHSGITQMNSRVQHRPRTLSITPKAARTQLVGSPMGSNTPNRSVVDLSHSPTMDEHRRPSQSVPLTPVMMEGPQQLLFGSHSDILKEGNALKHPTPNDTSRPSSSRRPRALSLFLRPTTETEATSTAASPLAPSTTGAHPRQRTNNTSPLLRRFSSNLFSHSPYSSTSPTPDSSLSLFTEAPSSTPAQPIPRPRLDEEETPEGYVQRLMEAVSKAEVAGVLAARNDNFHVQALKLYLEKFSFKNDPLDIAVRRLLMDLALPRETQQIDRVMEAFASRYNQCNPGLFAQPDQAYILAFSLIMLHTDAFNKSNKHKMTKTAYVKNTRLPGVQPEVLDYFFDNIVFAPFIFIEDPMDVNGQRGFNAESANSSSGFLSKAPKVDPYYLIASDLLDHLRIPVNTVIPPKTPYRYLGTAESWDYEELRQAFTEASVVELGDKDISKRITASHNAFSGFTAAPPAIIPLNLSTHAGMAPAAFNDVWTFKLTKIGIVNRKEDVLDGGKRASGRKWRQFKVALTGSQLLFFRDLKWDYQLVEKKGNPNVLTLPDATTVKPDEVLSVNDAVALFDTSYTKYRNTFRLVLPQGRQYLMQVLDEHELNEWLARINYASAFRTAGLRMRPTGLSGRDVELTGIAAANSHVRETLFWKQQPNGSSPNVHNWSSPDVSKADRGAEDTDEEDEGDGESSTDHVLSELAPKTRLLPFSRSTAALDVESAETMVHEDAERLKAAFEDVKAELATGIPITQKAPQSVTTQTHPPKSSLEKQWGTEKFPHEVEVPRERLSSRGTVIQLKITELEKRINSLQLQLESDLRCARNFAILTPFQHSTRQRLQEHIPPLAKRIQQLRLDLGKLQCHKEVLHADFVGDERQRYQTTRAALKVATATLKRRLGEPTPPTSAETSASGKHKPGSRPSVISKGSKRRQGSFASSASSTQEGTAPTLVHHSIAGSSKQALGRTSSSSRTRQEQLMLSIDEPSSTIEGSFSTPSKKSAETEQAEEWNKTKAAKRVSLVKVHRQSLQPLATKFHLDEALEHLAEIPSATNPSFSSIPTHKAA